MPGKKSWLHIISLPARLISCTFFTILIERATLATLAKDGDREINTISLQMTTLEKDGLVKKIRKFLSQDY